MTQWSSDLHVRIAEAIKSARGKRSAQWLADRTAELGYPITRAQIANYESGRKKSLDIAELIVLASALNTSPVNLVYPGPYNSTVEVLPGAEAPELAAAEWFSNISHWQAIDSNTPEERVQELRELGAEWLHNGRDLGRWRALASLERAKTDQLARGEFNQEIHDALDFYDKNIHRLRRELGIDEDA